MGPEDPDTLLKIFLHGKKTATENGDFIGVPNKNDKESGLLLVNFEASFKGAPNAWSHSVKFEFLVSCESPYSD